MQYAVSRQGTTLVTLHEGTDTTAIDAAMAELREALTTIAPAAWELEDGRVHEHPAAPFDPYTVAVDFAVTVTVEAPTEAEAEDAGREAIAEAVSSAGLEGITYTTAPETTAA